MLNNPNTIIQRTARKENLIHIPCKNLNISSNFVNISRELCCVLRNIFRRCEVYNNHLLNSNNKMKTTRNIIKSEAGRKDHDWDASINQQLNPASFNNYFSSIAEKISHNIKYNDIINSNINSTSMHYLSQSFKNAFHR
jgi:hypothetical protein